MIFVFDNHFAISVSEMHETYLSRISSLPFRLSSSTARQHGCRDLQNLRRGKRMFGGRKIIISFCKYFHLHFINPLLLAGQSPMALLLTSRSTQNYHRYHPRVSFNVDSINSLAKRHNRITPSALSYTHTHLNTSICIKIIYYICVCRYYIYIYT